MLAVLGNAVNYLVALIFRFVPIKFVFLIVLFLIFDVLLNIVWGLLPNWLNPQNVINLIPAELWYFLRLVSFDTGFPLIMAAYATRFLIRRIPFIG